MDYTFLVNSERVLKEYATEVLRYLKKPDLAVLNRIHTSEGKLIFRIGLAKREVWKYGNTTVLLVAGHEGTVLSYHSKKYFDDSKKKFDEVLVSLEQLAKKKGQKSEEDVEKL